MMLSGGLVALIFLLYMALLFVIAFWGDRRRAELNPRLRDCNQQAGKHHFNR